MKCADIVTLGYASVDHFLCIDTYPGSGQKVPYRSYSVMGGGQAATGAVALSRWGVTTRFIGRVGADTTGDRSIAWLEEEGVLTDAVIRTPGVTSQTAYILVPADTGERTVFWRREPGLNLRGEDIREEWLTGSSVLFIDGHELDAALEAARFMKRQGGTVVLDAEHIGPMRDKLLKVTDIAIGSEDFGMREFGSATPEATIGILRGCGVGFAGVTLGDRGSVVDWGAGIRRFRSIRVNAVDTTGAGDVFHAALAFGALKHYSPDDMIRFATVCAGLSCRALGGRSAIPDLQEVNARLTEEGDLEITDAG